MKNNFKNLKELSEYLKKMYKGLIANKDLDGYSRIRNKNIEIGSDESAVAYTDFKKIFISNDNEFKNKVLDIMSNLSKKPDHNYLEISYYLGMLCHEAGHILYTPNFTNQYTSFEYAFFNILEDGYIENILRGSKTGLLVKCLNYVREAHKISLLEDVEKNKDIFENFKSNRNDLDDNVLYSSICTELLIFAKYNIIIEGTLLEDFFNSNPQNKKLFSEIYLAKDRYVVFKKIHENILKYLEIDINNPDNNLDNASCSTNDLNSDMDTLSSSEQRKIRENNKVLSKKMAEQIKSILNDTSDDSSEEGSQGQEENESSSSGNNSTEDNRSDSKNNSKSSSKSKLNENNSSENDSNGNSDELDKNNRGANSDGKQSEESDCDSGNSSGDETEEESDNDSQNNSNDKSEGKGQSNSESSLDEENQSEQKEGSKLKNSNDKGGFGGSNNNEETTNEKSKENSKEKTNVNRNAEAIRTKKDVNILDIKEAKKEAKEFIENNSLDIKKGIKKEIKAVEELMTSDLIIYDSCINITDNAKDTVKQNKIKYKKEIEHLYRYLCDALPKEKGEVLYEQSSGKIHTKSLVKSMCENKYDYFKREIDPAKPNDINFYLILDLSGSMTNYRMIKSCQDVIFIIDQALKRVNIPVNIIGHTTLGYNVTIYNFEDSCEKLYSFNYDEMNANIDYYALKFIYDKIKHRSSNSKNIVFVLSDGLPCGLVEEYRNLISKDEKNNCVVFGCGLGDYKEKVNSFFKKVILFDKISEFPKQASKIIKRYL